MKIDYLRYFLAAATHGSFAAAGLKMHISPTSIGYAVDKLEDELSTSLFVRIPSKGLALTPDGEALRERARLVLSEMESIEEYFAGPESQFRGELVVGCQEGLMWSLMPRMIKVFAQRHPDLRISMISTDIGSDFALLDQGKIDVLLTFVLSSVSSKTYEIRELVSPELFAMMRQGHALDDGSEFTSLHALGQYPQVMNNEPTSFDIVYESYKQYGITPEIGFLSNMSAGAQAIVGNSDCVSLRFVRPATNASPLSDPLVFKRIEEDTLRPSVIVAKVKARSQDRRTKRDAFMEICNELFDSGEMRAHFFY